MVMMVVVMTFRVQDTISKLVNAVAEGVVVAVFVVVTHLVFLGSGGVPGIVDRLLGDLDFLEMGRADVGRVNRGFVDMD